MTALFRFYNEEEFVGFAFAISNTKAFYVSFFCHYASLAGHGYGRELLKN